MKWWTSIIVFATLTGVSAGLAVNPVVITPQGLARAWTHAGAKKVRCRLETQGLDGPVKAPRIYCDGRAILHDSGPAPYNELTRPFSALASRTKPVRLYVYFENSFVTALLNPTTLRAYRIQAHCTTPSLDAELFRYDPGGCAGVYARMFQFIGR